MVDVDSKTLFNGAAALLATVAVVFFLLTVEWGHSPVTKVGLVVAFLAGVFAITQRTDDRQLTLLGYAVIVTSAVAVFVEVVNTFQAGNTVTVLGLLVIAAVLFGLRTRLDGNNHFVTGRTATSAMGVLVALAVVLLALDLVTGGLAYELRTEEAVTVPDSNRDEVRIASVVATNPTPLPERVDVPHYGVCTAGDWSAYRPPGEEGQEERSVRANLNVRDGYDEHVLSFGERTFPVILYLGGANLTGETFPVERTSSCPDDATGSPYLAVFERSERRPYAHPD